MWPATWVAWIIYSVLYATKSLPHRHSLPLIRPPMSRRQGCHITAPIAKRDSPASQNSMSITSSITQTPPTLKLSQKSTASIARSPLAMREICRPMKRGVGHSPKANPGLDVSSVPPRSQPEEIEMCIAIFVGMEPSSILKSQTS